MDWTNYDFTISGIFIFVYTFQNGNAAQVSFTRWLLVVLGGGGGGKKL